ncbi:hypothetical protein HYH02_011079 [Chlamydomonas schloesseri]|uniref:RNA polymerase-associated protein LEO1 n=1 Tax=Chlamydomonas schloesseri TaxID=2026947 RepID=A0A835T5D0_9CHLO|nr:hypothetical protein HYH02_011079 [Chlamydomonas schloesseri]|eukprot:KAG2437701.1 hypothetical protein HYH02_011079 [Chlamydomonas schloesseri]
MASDDEDQMKDLFGSDDDADNDFGKPTVRETQKEATPVAEDDLEDDLGDDLGGTATQGRSQPAIVSDEPEEEGGFYGRSKRAAPGGRRPLTKTGAPIDFSAPLLPVPPPSGDTFLLREALIGVEPRPFDPETYEAEEEIFIDDKGFTKIKPADRTKIRWRYVQRKTADGRDEIVPESNARFVRWSDGSLQLLLGDEVFDVDTADISSQHAYMVAYSGVVQGQAALTTKMGFRLATLNSKLYARMREEVDKRTVKVKRVQQHVEAYDPAKEKERRAREAEELLRNRAALESRQQRVTARFAGGGGGGGGRRGRPELNTRFLEEEDGLEGGAYGRGDDGFIDDGDDDGGAYARRRRMNDAEEASSDSLGGEVVSGRLQEEAARRLQSAKRGGAGGSQPGGGGAGGKRRRVQEESEDELPDDDEEEEEYVDSEEEEGSDDEEGGGGEEGSEEDEEDEDEGGRREGRQKSKTPPPRPAAPPLRGKVVLSARPSSAAGGGGGPPAAKVRRGVVLSDDEDD